jgi:3-methyladenine DNA glycosylase AlkD
MKMTTANEIKKRLRKTASAKKAKGLSWFFKTGPGEYGEGDKFLGIVVPNIRAAIKDCREISFGELSKLFNSPFHEERMAGALILVNNFIKVGAAERKKIYKFYIKNIRRINNWDLVDLSAPTIIGGYLLGVSPKEKKQILIKLSDSKNMWSRRIAILATFAFIRTGRLRESLALAKKYLADKEDLMHKATGWMLREVGKRNPEAEKKFLEKYAGIMPRTMLRYAIEKFSEAERKYFMKK